MIWSPFPYCIVIQILFSERTSAVCNLWVDWLGSNPIQCGYEQDGRVLFATQAKSAMGAAARCGTYGYNIIASYCVFYKLQCVDARTAHSIILHVASFLFFALLGRAFFEGQSKHTTWCTTCSSFPGTLFRCLIVAPRYNSRYIYSTRRIHGTASSK